MRLLFELIQARGELETRRVGLANRVQKMVDSLNSAFNSSPDNTVELFNGFAVESNKLRRDIEELEKDDQALSREELGIVTCVVRPGGIEVV